MYMYSLGTAHSAIKPRDRIPRVHGGPLNFQRSNEDKSFEACRQGHHNHLDKMYRRDADAKGERGPAHSTLQEC